MSEVKEISRTQCPSCLDQGHNNLAVYSDGHTYCYSCNQVNPGEMPISAELAQRAQTLVSGMDINLNDKLSGYTNFIPGEYKELKARGISQEICQFMDYQIGLYTGKFGSGEHSRFANNEQVHIANYYDQTRKSAQKIRSRYKEFLIFGEKEDKKNMSLYGQWKWSPNKNVFCIITEGEIDQLTVLQSQGTQYPVVSVPKGAGDAKKAIEANLEWLLGWKYIVLALDNDDRGKEATEQCIKLLEPGTFRIIEWPEKDANDTFLKKGKEAVTKAIWSAKEIIPKKVVTVSNIMEKVLEQPQLGDSMPWNSLSDAMYGGTRGGEIIVLVGASGTGKTCMIKDIVCYKLDRMNVGIFSFEHSPEDTIRRYVGARLGLKLHKPGTTWNKDLIREIALEFDNKLFLFDKQGRVDVDEMFYSMRYMAKARGVRLFIIDNLKALGVTLKKDVLISFMNKLKGFVKDLNVDVILVSHVNRDSVHSSAHIGFSSKPNTKQWTQTEVNDMMATTRVTWATGRMPTAENIEGGNDIEAIADYCIYLARNKEAEDRQLQRTLTVKIGKCGRIDSEYSGMQFKLYYDDNGNYVEVKHNEVF